MNEKINVAIIGGGLPTLIALGGYSVICDVIKPKTVSFSSDSLGATVVTSLAMEKTPLEIRDFLARNAVLFGLPYVGKGVMRQRVDEFLGGIKFKDLPVECFISIALSSSGKFWKDVTPFIVTRANSRDWTVGEVVAMSSSVPIMYLSSNLELHGKRYRVFDGGLAINPPLNPDTKNALFSYENPGSRKGYSWNRKARWPQEKKATVCFHPYTDKFGMCGNSKDVYSAFEFGKKAMQSEAEKFLRDLGLGI